MLRNTLFLRVVSALAIGLAIAGAPGLSHAASPFSLPAAGMGSAVLINQDTGANEMLTVNFAGTSYSVAPQGSTSPNQVEFNIPPGTYSYTASVVGIGSVNGSVTIPQGHVISLAFVDNSADLANGDQNGDDQATVVQQVVSNSESEDENSENEDKDNDGENGEDEGGKSAEGAGQQELSKIKPLVKDAVKDKIQSIVTDAAKNKDLTTDPSQVKSIVTDAAKNKIKSLVTDAAKGKITTLPFNPGKISNFVAGGNKPNTSTNTTNHVTTNNACAPGSPLFPACAGGKGSSGKSGKKGDLLTISFTPADNGATNTVAADEGKNKNHNDDDSDEGSETTTVTNVTQPAVDNDELIVTVTDVTSPAQ